LADPDVLDKEKWILSLNFDKVFKFEIVNFKEVAIENIPSEDLELLAQRQKARNEKNWELSDKIRDQLNAKGYKILDGKDGAKLKPI